MHAINHMILANTARWQIIIKNSSLAYTKIIYLQLDLNISLILFLFSFD